MNTYTNYQKRLGSQEQGKTNSLVFCLCFCLRVAVRQTVLARSSIMNARRQRSAERRCSAMPGAATSCMYEPARRTAIPTPGNNP